MKQQVYRGKVATANSMMAERLAPRSPRALLKAA